MSDMRLFLELMMKGQGRFNSDLQGVASSTKQTTQQMSRSWGTVNNSINHVFTSMRRLAIFVGGGALLRQAINDVTEFERGLTEVRLTGGLTADAMAKMREEILQLAIPTLQLPEDELRAFQNMVAAGVDPRQAIKGMKAIGRTATAEFADINDIASTSIDLMQKMGIKPEKLERAFNILATGGKEGRFELKDMSKYFPEVLAPASRYGIKGEKGTAQIAAMLQIARRNRGQPSEAATDMKAFFSHIVPYGKNFSKVGFKVSDYIDLKSGQFKQGKDIDMFFEELKKKTHGGSDAMLSAIGIQDQEARNFMAGLMKEWDLYKKIRDKALQGADGNVVEDDFKVVSETSFGKQKKLTIDKSKAMKSLGSSKMAEWYSNALNWALENPVQAGGMALGAFGLYKMGSKYLGGKNLPGSSMMGGGIPVTVTNMPKMLNNMPSDFKSSGGIFGNPPKPKVPIWQAATVPAIPAVATAVAAWASMEIGEYVSETDAARSSTKRLMELRARHMVMGGGPGSYQVGLIDSELKKRGLEVKNLINLSLSIDKDSRTTLHSDDRNTELRMLPSHYTGITDTIPSHPRGSFDKAIMGSGL